MGLEFNSIQAALFGQTNNVQSKNAPKNTNGIQNIHPAAEPVKISSTEYTSANFSTDLEAVQGKVKMNSPESQGLASAEALRNGQLVSGYHFNSLGDDIDTKLFDLKYSSANTPQIAKGTEAACNGVEYAQVAGYLQAKNNPYSELFS